MKMKKLKSLNIHRNQLMNDNQLKSLKGGDTFYCYCGFVTNPQSGVITVTAPTLYDALSVMGYICNGAGATCNGA